MNDIKFEMEQVQEVYVRRSADDFMLFLSGLIVPSGRGPVLLQDVMAPHQQESFSALAPSLQALRKGQLPPVRRFWIERTKKASKDTDIAACLLWLLAYPYRPLFIQIGAVDQDQAAIVKRRMEDYLHYNPWLAERIDIQRNKIVSTNRLVVCEILAADVAGSHGETPDLLVCNELSHVTKWEFIQNLLDNADGVPQGIVLIATNAGFKGTHAWKLKTVVEANQPMWKCLYFKQPAPWHSVEFVAEAEKRNTPSRYRRLWWGEWVSGKGDAFDDSMITRCFIPGLQELTAPEPGWAYIGGLDLGISHDHAGVVILGVQPQQRRLRLAHMRGFAPDSRTGEIDLTAVERHCLIFAKQFRLRWFGYDPYQAKLMAQRLMQQGVGMQEVPFTGVQLNQMASALMSVLKEGLLEAYDTPDNQLQKDLGKFNVVERSYGYRLDALRDETGHADIGTALAICLPHAVKMLGGAAVHGDDKMVYDEDGSFTEDEVQELPNEFKEIFGVYDDIAKRNRKRTRIGDDLF